MKLTKRLLSMLLAVTLVLSLMPAFVFAEETVTPKTTWTDVATADALTTALTNGGNVRLIASFTYAGGNTIGKNPVVLDLNGQTLSVSKTMLADGSDVTVVGTGKVVCTDGFIKSSNGTVVNIDGGIITAPASSKVLWTNSTTDKLNIHDGNITGIIQVNYGTVNVYGGKINTKINPVGVKTNPCYVNIYGGTVALLHYSHLNANTKVNITGGVINGMSITSTVGTVSVTGGTFKTVPTAYMPAGYGVVANTDGTYTVMKITEVDTIDEMKAAVANAVDGEIIMLVGNIGVNENWDNTSGNGMSVKKNVILDLNGYTLRFRLAESTVVPIQVAANAKLTIKDSSAAGTGAIEGNALTDKTGMHLIRNAGELIVESGNIRHITMETETANALNTHLIFHQDGATTTIKGGNFTVLGGGYAVTKNSSYIGTLSVSGGTFNKAPASVFIATGYVVEDNGDGTCSIVSLITSQDAFLDAMLNVKDGNVVRLDGNINLRNISSDWNVTVSKDITLDLNGYTLNYLLDGDDYTPITVSSGASLIITDNSTAGTGAIIGTLDSTNLSGRHLIANYGTLTIEKGRFAIEKKTGDETQYNSSACVVITFENSSTFIEGGSFASATTGKPVHMASKSALMHITGGVYTKAPDPDYLGMYYNAVKQNDGTYIVSSGEIHTVEDLMNAITVGGSYILKSDLTVDAAATLTVRASTRLEFNGCRITVNANHNSNVIGLVNKDTTLALHAMDGGGITAIYNSTVNDRNVVALFRVNLNGTSEANWTNTHLQVYGGSYELLEGENENHVRPAKTVTMFNITGSSDAYCASGAVFYTEYNHLSSGTNPSFGNGVRCNVDLSACIADPTVSHVRFDTDDGINWYTVDMDPMPQIVEVDSAAELKYYLENDVDVKLVGNIELTNENADQIVISGWNAELDLNGFTITATVTNPGEADFTTEGYQGYKGDKHFFTLTGGASLNVIGGTINVQIVTNNYTANLFRVNSVETLILDGVTVNYAYAEGVTVAGYYCDIVNANGKVVMSEGTKLYNAVGGTLYGWGKADITVNGGMMNKTPRMADDLSYTVPAGLVLADTDGDGWYALETAKYTVTWDVAGELTEETYEFGAMPSFNGSTDKAAIGNTGYNFIGWDKEISAVTGDVTYTAQYQETKLVEFRPEANVVAGNNLDMAFALNVNDVREDDVVVITRTYGNGNADEVTKIAVKDLDKVDVYYIVMYKGLAAKEMSDELTLVVQDKDGREIGVPKVDSMRAYAMRGLRKAGATELEKRLFVDMLIYGAEAQKFFGYATDNLATAGLTEAELALASESKTYVDDSKRGDKCLGTNLIIESNISFRLAFKGMTEGMRAVVTYKDHMGKAQTVNYAAKDIQWSGSIGMIFIDTLVLADARQEVTIKIYNADDTLYTTCQDSIEAYLARGDNASDVYAAIMRFSDTAREYLHLNKQ